MMQNLDDEKITPEQFAFWLQGFFEMTDAKVLTERQVKMVKDHLKLVFKKVTPDYSIKTTGAEQTITIKPQDFVSPTTHPVGCRCLECGLSGKPPVVTSSYLLRC